MSNKITSSIIIVALVITMFGTMGCVDGVLTAQSIASNGCGEPFCYTDNGMVCGDPNYLGVDDGCRPSDERTEVHISTAINNIPHRVGCIATVHFADDSSDIGWGISGGFFVDFDGVSRSYPYTIIERASGNYTKFTIRPHAICQIVGAEDTMRKEG